MQAEIKRKHLGTLQKRRAFLTGRIFASRKDLSFDKAEAAALRYAADLINRDIEKTLEKVVV